MTLPGRPAWWRPGREEQSHPGRSGGMPPRRWMVSSGSTANYRPPTPSHIGSSSRLGEQVVGRRSGWVVAGSNPGEAARFGSGFATQSDRADLVRRSEAAASVARSQQAPAHPCEHPHLLPDRRPLQRPPRRWTRTHREHRASAMPQNRR